MPVLTPTDYLDLTQPVARAEWVQILSRQVTPGRRQEAFTPVETVLCLAASLLVNHHRYGGSTSHLAPTPVPELARLFRRPSTSVLAKMANLDGSRRKGARHEIAVASVLLGDPAHLAELYRTAVAAARSTGVDDGDLPDFLGLEAGGGHFALSGQEELDGGEVESSVEAAAAAWAGERGDGLTVAETERLLVGAVRVGQHRFAGQVLANYRHQCAFCGLRQLRAQPGARGLLFASHIKPWRASAGPERLDPGNGVAACPTHDVAFDTGLLTVAADGAVLLSPLLERAALGDPAAAAVFGRPPLAASLRLPAGAAPPAGRYLDWHRANLFAAA